MQIAIPRYYNRQLSNQEIYRLYNSKKNMNPPRESFMWWWPCLLPQCWVGLKHIWPMTMDIDLHTNSL